MSANTPKVPAMEGCFSTIDFNNTLTCLYIDINNNLSSLTSSSGISNWNYQDLNNIEKQAPTADSNFCCVSYYQQLHHFYINQQAQISDIYYDQNKDQWFYQNLNQLVPDAPTAQGELFAVTYNTQQHNLYLDASGDINDIWYDASTCVWQHQNLNSICPSAPKLAHSLKVVFCNDQLHHLYIDQNKQLSDIWHDWKSNTWHYENLSTNNPSAPLAGNSLNAVAYNDCLHTVYQDANGDISYIFRDFGADTWQYDNLSGAVNSAPTLLTGLSCAYYNTQLHVTYIDSNSQVIDIFQTPDDKVWHIQNVSRFQSSAPIARGELWPTPYGNQLHYIYVDMNDEISDIYYGDSTWAYQNIGNLPNM